MGQSFHDNKFGTSNDSQSAAFYTDRRYKSVKEAWEHSLDENVWRHSIVISNPTLDRKKKAGISAQGDTENVRDEEVRRRLKYIRARLLRAIWGNHWQGKGQIMYLVFRQGKKKSYNVHYHALMAIVGKHDWSDEAVEMAIQAIEKNRTKESWEKEAKVDCRWRKGNAMHSYCSREVHLEGKTADLEVGDWFVF